MLAEKIIRKPIVIGDRRYTTGDVLPDEAADLLPRGRLKVLQDQGYVEERPSADTSGVELLAELVARIDSLEERMEKVESRRGPGRPKKVE